MKIGFDLDGVIISTSDFKIDQYEKLTKVKLDKWQVNANVIDEYIKDKPTKRELERLSALFNNHPLVDSAFPAMMQKKATKHEFYLISARGRNEEGKEAARQNLAKYDLHLLFQERIFFVVGNMDKSPLIKSLGLDLYVDDRQDIVAQLPNSVGVLFDEHDLFKKTPDLFSRITSFNDLHL